MLVLSFDTTNGHMPIYIHILYTYTVEDDGNFKGKLKDEIIVDRNSVRKNVYFRNG